MRSRLLTITLSLMGLLGLIVTGCSTGGGDKVNVPIKIQTDESIVAVALELLYDPLVLEAVSVDKSTLTTGARAAYDMSEPGVLLILVSNAENLDHNGTLVVAHFKILDETGSSDLAVDFKAAEDAVTHEALPFEVTDGRFDGGDKSVVAPVITIG